MSLLIEKTNVFVNTVMAQGRQQSACDVPNTCMAALYDQGTANLGLQVHTHLHRQLLCPQLGASNVGIPL